MTPQDKAAFNAAWAIYCQQVGRDEEWEFEAGFEAALSYMGSQSSVIRQLVDGLAGLIDFIEIDNLRIDQDALRIAKAAIAAAKDAGL